MSKQIKQMEMNALRSTFQGVRDLVVLQIKGLNAAGTYNLRASLRKKNIRLQVVKNSLTRRVFAEMGMQISEDSAYWRDNIVLAWGGSSIAQLCREIDGELKNPKVAAVYKDKVTRKGAIADGQAIPFEVGMEMPTREEAIGQILAMILSPGAQIAGCLVSPGGQVAGQIQTVSEKKEGEPAAPATAS
jgi:large subunit ribosomal protein L10